MKHYALEQLENAGGKNRGRKIYHCQHGLWMFCSELVHFPNLRSISPAHKYSQLEMFLNPTPVVIIFLHLATILSNEFRWFFFYKQSCSLNLNHWIPEQAVTKDEWEKTLNALLSAAVHVNAHGLCLSKEHNIWPLACAHMKITTSHLSFFCPVGFQSWCPSCEPFW